MEKPSAISRQRSAGEGIFLRFVTIIGFILAGAICASAQVPVTNNPSSATTTKTFNKVDYISFAADGIGTVADMWISQRITNRAIRLGADTREQSPIFADRNGHYVLGKDIAFSLAVLGGSIAVQRLFPKAKPAMQALRISLGAGRGITAVSNQVRCGSGICR